MNNNLIIALFVVFLLVCVPAVFLYLTDHRDLGIQIATGVYFALVIGFLVYFHTQSRSKAALKKKLYEIEEKERAEAEAFIRENRRKLFEERGRAETNIKRLKYKGLSRAEREVLDEKERLDDIRKLGIKEVKSSAFY